MRKNLVSAAASLIFLLAPAAQSADTLLVVQQFGAAQGIPAEVLRGVNAVGDLQRRINDYESEKLRLTQESQLNGGKGVKALGAKNMLAQLPASPLAENVRRAMISAKQSYNAAMILYGSDLPPAQASVSEPPITTIGALQWMYQELQEKEQAYAVILGK